MEIFMKTNILILAILGLFSVQAAADEQIVVVRAIDANGAGSIIGTVKFSDSEKGLVIDPDLGNLAPGRHGFHVHEKPSCEPGEKDGKKVAGLGAGGHFDPHKISKHAGPEGHGHHGDLPALDVGENGEAVKSMVASKLKLADIKGHALIIHEGGDNYSDDPKPLGGGGARIACGIIE
jgi:Cu-Zn family superoxide dismutase